MSIGDLTTYGNKGNNFPWQLKMLQGLQGIIDQLQADIDVNIISPIGQQPMADSVSVTIASDQTGIARTPNLIRTTNEPPANVNTIVPVFYSVSVANVGTADGVVLGQPIKPGEILNFSADAVNNYFTSFTYNSTGTELIITFIS